MLPLLSILILEQRCHSEKWAAVPPGPKQWYRWFCLGGEAGHRNAVLSKGTDFIWQQNLGKLKPKGAVKNNGNFGSN